MFFTYALVLTTFYKVNPASVGLYLIVFAAGNFAGPLILGRLFDTLGRRVMIRRGTYLLSGLMLGATAALFDAGHPDRFDSDGRMGCRVLFRLCRGQRGISHSQRNLSDGDTRFGDRLLLRPWYGSWRHHRASVVRLAHRKQQAISCCDRLCSRRVLDVRDGHSRDFPRRRRGSRCHSRTLRPRYRPNRMLNKRLVPLPTGPSSRKRPMPVVRRGEHRNPPPGDLHYPPWERACMPRSVWAPIPQASNFPRTDPYRRSEIERVVQAMEDAPWPVSYAELASRTGGRYWGPGRLRAAIRGACTRAGSVPLVGTGTFSLIRLTRRLERWGPAPQ